MSNMSFHVPQAGTLTDEQRARIRRHFLAYVQAEAREGRSLHDDLDQIYSSIDSLMASDTIERLISVLHTSAHVVLFATEASKFSLTEFQLAMLSEERKVRLVSESSSDVNGIGALGQDDLLVVVTTSNGFALRQRRNIERSAAYKAIVTANDDPDLHACFDSVLSIGNGAQEGSPLHRIYATYGVTYFFDRLFSTYAQAYDPSI